MLIRCHKCGALHPKDKWVPLHPIQSESGQIFVREFTCSNECLAHILMEEEEESARIDREALMGIRSFISTAYVDDRRMP